MVLTTKTIETKEVVKDEKPFKYVRDEEGRLSIKIIRDEKPEAPKKEEKKSEKKSDKK